MGEVPLSLAAALLALDESDHFHIRIVEVGADVEVVDAAETDERRPDRPIIGMERRVVMHSRLSAGRHAEAVDCFCTG